jgi:hypothetical protein
MGARLLTQNHRLQTFIRPEMIAKTIKITIFALL